MSTECLNGACEAQASPPSTLHVQLDRDLSLMTIGIIMGTKCLQFELCVCLYLPPVRTFIVVVQLKYKKIKL